MYSYHQKKMKLRIMIETKKFEKSWNVMRFMVMVRKTGMK